MPLTRKFQQHVKAIAVSDAKNPEVQNRHSALLKEGPIGPMISFSGNEANPLFHRTDRGYEEVGATMGLSRIEDGRGMAILDLDQDGTQDVVIHNHFRNPIVALLNRTESPQHWLRLRLRGKASNRFGIGARVTVNRRIQELACGMGYLSANAPELHFGLGVAEQAAVEIRWPSGRVDRYDGLRGNRIWTLYEGEPAKAEEVELKRVAVEVKTEDPPAPVEPDPRPLAGEGAAVVVYFSVDCFACRQELLREPYWAAAAKAAGLRLVWANVDADPARVAAEWKQNGMPFEYRRAAEAGRGVEVPRACLLRPGHPVETFVGRWALEAALEAAKPE